MQKHLNNHFTAFLVISSRVTETYSAGCEGGVAVLPNGVGVSVTKQLSLVFRLYVLLSSLFTEASRD